MNESFNNKVKPYAPVENAGHFNYEQTANGNSYRSPELERLGELVHEYAESANQTIELLRVNYIKLDSPEPEKNPLTPEQEIAAASQNVVKFRTECLEGEFGLAA